MPASMGALGYKYCSDIFVAGLDYLQRNFSIVSPFSIVIPSIVPGAANEAMRFVGRGLGSVIILRRFRFILAGLQYQE
jgi:hypothetical protein